MRAAVLIIALAVSASLPAPASARDAGASGLASVPAPAPDAPAAVAATSSQEVQLGRTFYLLVTVTYPAGLRVNLPSSLGLGRAFDEGDRTHDSVENDDGTITRTYEIALVPFVVGDLQIPPVPVVYTADGKSYETVSNPVPISVIGVIGDGEATLRDIAPPVEIEAPNRPLIIAMASLLAIVLLLLGFFVVRLWLRRRVGRRARPRRAAQAGPALSPEKEALARLDEIEASGLVDGDDRKRAYLELSETVRGYLGRRYDFPALDSTTSEIVAHLSAMPDGPRIVERLGDWLEQCDLVKFANVAASADEARRALYEARRFVEATRSSETSSAVEVMSA